MFFLHGSALLSYMYVVLVHSCDVRLILSFSTTRAKFIIGKTSKYILEFKAKFEMPSYTMWGDWEEPIREKSEAKNLVGCLFKFVCLNGYISSHRSCHRQQILCGHHSGHLVILFWLYYSCSTPYKHYHPDWLYLSSSFSLAMGKHIVQVYNFSSTAIKENNTNFYCLVNVKCISTNYPI